MKGVSKSATAEEIDSAYLEKVSSLPHAHEYGNMRKEMQHCLEAYETLMDEDSRKLYDQKCEVDEIVRNMTDSKSDQIREESIPTFHGKSKNGLDETMSEEQRQWFAKFAGGLLLIVLIPKIIYILYQELKGNSVIR